MFSSVVVSLALAASVLANLFITNPVASTTMAAGQQANISWVDDGNSPSIAQWGIVTLAIYVGNANQQTLVQTVATNANVSAISSITFVPSASIGPNSGEYFIRATSQSLKDSASPKYYQEAFSAKFTLTGMSGSFNSSVQAEINGQSTAPIGGTPTTSSPSGTGTGASAPSLTVSSPQTASPTTSANGAGKPVIATGFVALVATLVGASFL